MLLNFLATGKHDTEGVWNRAHGSTTHRVYTQSRAKFPGEWASGWAINTLVLFVHFICLSVLRDTLALLVIFYICCCVKSWHASPFSCSASPIEPVFALGRRVIQVAPTCAACIAVSTGLDPIGALWDWSQARLSWDFVWPGFQVATPAMSIHFVIPCRNV